MHIKYLHLCLENDFENCDDYEIFADNMETDVHFDSNLNVHNAKTFIRECKIDFEK